jgi:DNA-binding Lrp family transcriptional regulator
MSQLSKVAKVLQKNNKGAGITVAQVARLTGIPKASVSKRVYDLRTSEGHTIYSNYRNVNGQRKLFYRFAA